MPALRYRNVSAASEWLVTVLGFAPHHVVTSDDGTILIAQLAFGDDLVMLSRDAGSDGTAAGGSAEAQSCYFVVADADAHCKMAKAAGADIVADIAAYEHGGRIYSCRDPEGHIWNFGTYDPWQASGARQRRPRARTLVRGLTVVLLLTIVATATVAGIFVIPQQRAQGSDDRSPAAEAIASRQGGAAAEVARHEAMELASRRAELASAQSARFAAERSLEEVRARLAQAEAEKEQALRNGRDNAQHLAAVLEEGRRERAAAAETVRALREQLASHADAGRAAESGARPGEAAANALERETAPTAGGVAERATTATEPDPPEGAVVTRSGEERQDADRATSAQAVPDPEQVFVPAGHMHHRSHRLAEQFGVRERLRAARARARCRASFPDSPCE
jgi:uncharacterized glyoxalase superfamily protein PhnB